MKTLSIKIYSFFNNDKFKISLFILLVFLSVFSIYTLQPKISGDSVTYVQSMDVLRYGVTPSDFAPNRIVTSYLGLRLIMFITLLTTNLPFSWLLLNSLLYIFMGMFFYSLLVKIINIPKVAFLSTLFLVTNYSAVVFGLGYLLDIGGWAFYIISLYYSYRYLETREKSFLYFAAGVIGIGGLFKEYAFLAFVVVFGLIIFNYWKDWKNIINKIFITGLLAFVPMLILNIHVFSIYHYTYLDWFFNQPHYVYNSRILEYIKSFGSLYNFGWFLFLGGVYILFKRSKEILRDKNILFIWLVVISSLIVFVWPVVTRVLFITIPGVVLVSSLFIQRMEKKWYLVVGLLILYVLSSYFMDAYILNIVNIDSLLSHIL